MKRVIFVDVDGVLNNDKWANETFEEYGYNPFDRDELFPASLLLLKRLIEDTNAAVVISSSWRWDKNAYAALKNQLTEYGISIYDTTDISIKTYHSRSDEIKEWLSRHPEIDNYIILDDAIIEDSLAPHWVKTTMWYGFRHREYLEALEKINDENLRIYTK